VVRAPLWPTRFAVYASPLLFTSANHSVLTIGDALRQSRNTRYGRVVSPYEKSSRFLSRPGLAPGKKRQASLGALAFRQKSASCFRRASNVLSLRRHVTTRRPRRTADRSNGEYTCTLCFAGKMWGLREMVLTGTEPEGTAVVRRNSRHTSLSLRAWVRHTWCMNQCDLKWPPTSRSATLSVVILIRGFRLGTGWDVYVTFPVKPPPSVTPFNASKKNVPYRVR
jgi:hypothetical protein